MYEEHRRSALKSVSWRAIAASTGMFLVYAFTRELELTAGFGIADIVLKMIFYFLHERAWNRIEYGRGLLGTVESAMRSPAITALHLDTISSVVQKIIAYDIGAVIVTDGNRPVGIVTERDVLERLFKTSEDPTEALAKDIMSSPIIEVDYGKSLMDALEIMRDRKIRRLAVTQEGEVIGITTQRRILEAIMHKRHLQK